MKQGEVCWAENPMHAMLLVGNISSYGVVLQTVTKGVVAKTSPTEKRKLPSSRVGRGPRAARFSHFSVKELLRSKPPATLLGTVSEAN